jgi:hypothetical protein
MQRTLPHKVKEVCAIKLTTLVLGGNRADAMVLDDNGGAHLIWQAGGYRPQPEWSRWVKPL